MPLVSIIIPAYNAGSRIGGTLRKILEQRFQDFELLVVNDGSTDDTLSVVQKLASEEPRIRVMTVPNGGPAKARNFGMRQAKGQFVLFSDDDDALLTMPLLRIAQKARETDADVVITGFSIMDRISGRETEYVCRKPGLFTRDTLGEELGSLYIGNLLNQCWAKLYKTSFLLENQLTFSDYKFGEDRLFIFDCLHRAERFLVTEEKTYKYYVNTNGSLANRYYDKKFEACSRIDVSVRALAEELSVNTPENRRIFDYMYMKSVVSCLITVFSGTCPLSGAEKRRYYRTILSDPQVKSSVRENLHQGAAGEILRRSLATGSVSWNLFTVRLVNLANHLLPGLFIRIKHRK